MNIDKKSLDIIKKKVASKIASKILEQSFSSIEKVKKVSIKIFPTHFVSIPITDPQVLSNIKSVQDYVIEQNALFQKACINLQKIHITLLLLSIDEDYKEKEVTSLMKDIWLNVAEPLKEPFNLNFKGIQDFHKKVIYAGLNHESGYNHLSQIRDELRERFMKSGYSKQGDILIAPTHITDGFYFDKNETSLSCQNEFTPHLTIMKLSKMSRARKRDRIRHIDPGLYEEKFGGHFEFGTQTVTSIHLCRMKTAEVNDQLCASTSGYDNLGTINLS